jgi:hypothetical protein
MIYSQINNKTFSQLSIHEMLDFFVQHTFFLFMEQGRSGIKHAAKDIVDNFVTWMVIHGTISERDVKEISKEKYVEIQLTLIKAMTDGFIKEGSNGLLPAILLVTTLLANSKGSIN